MVRWIVLAAIVIISAFVAIVAGWQFGLWVIILAAVVFGILYNRGLGEDSIRGWSSALYGNKREDANHWSRTGGKRKR